MVEWTNSQFYLSVLFTYLICALAYISFNWAYNHLEKMFKCKFEGCIRKFRYPNQHDKHEDVCQNGK